MIEALDERKREDGSMKGIAWKKRDDRCIPGQQRSYLRAVDDKSIGLPSLPDLGCAMGVYWKGPEQADATAVGTPAAAPVADGVPAAAAPPPAPPAP